MNRKGASGYRAQIEMLESRRLLSAGPVSVAALRTHPTAPNVLGIYNGTFTGSFGTSPSNGTLEFDFTSESKAGKLSGTAAVPVAEYILHGSINVKGKFSLHGTRPNEILTATGTASADGTTLTGNFTVKLKHNTHVAFHGVYTASRT